MRRLVVAAGVVGLAIWFYVEACSPVSPGAVAPRSANAPRADPSRLAGDVRALASDIGPRNARYPEGMRRAQAYIEQAFEASEMPTSLQAMGVASFVNVIAGPRTGRRWVIGAHYDSFRDTPGADDNASGVAGLLELSRLLKARPLRTPVELVAYALEEPPYFGTEEMGSVVHARSIAQDDDVVGVIVLEMIGAFSDEPRSQRYPARSIAARYPDVANFITVIGRAEDQPLVDAVRDGMSITGGVPVYGYAAPVMVLGIDFSDHRSYWATGRKAVMVTDTAFFRNERYHSETDNPDTLDYDRMAKVIDGLYALLEHH